MSTASSSRVVTVDQEKASTGSDTKLVDEVDQGPPDGGYGWVVVGCQFFISSATWGVITAFAVYLSFYRTNNFFPGATDLQYALVGGLYVGAGLGVSPISNALSNCFGFKAPMFLGILLQVLSQIFAGLSTTLWELFLTQGLMGGLGTGLTWIPTIPILSQWFLKRRALASGIALAGTGGGSLFFSLVTRTTVERLGLRWAFIINGLICLVVLIPSVLLMKSRIKTQGAVPQLRDARWLVHPGFFWIALWTIFSLLAYVITVFSIPTFATAGLGLTQTQGANLQAILSAGQVVGRPLVGLLMDRIGRINGISIVTFISGLSCLVIWMFSESYGLLIFFCIVQGLIGGSFWSAVGPVTAEVVGIPNMASAMALVWLVGVLPSTFGEAIGITLIDYSQTYLGRFGSSAYLISIGFSGGCFIVATIAILGAKVHLQGNWKIWQKS